MHPPTSIFKSIFDVYNFSIISNPFDNNEPYALPLACISENVRTKCIIFDAALRIRVKTLNKICLKIIQKALLKSRYSIYVNFQNISGGACP